MLTEEMEYLKKQTSYALEYTGYTLWWWGSRVLEAGLGWAARKTHGAHMWSVGAAPSGGQRGIPAGRERLH
jgi:hypothetical protein